MDTISFVVNVGEESAAQVSFCLKHLRSCYPIAPVVIIQDGLRNAEIDAVAAKHGAHHIYGAYLKRAECGGAWWHRTLHAASQIGSDYVVKIDPDTRINKRFSHLPTGNLSSAVAGRLHNNGTPLEIIQGGAQLFHQTVIDQIIQSGALLDENLKCCYSYISKDVHGELIKPWWLSQGYLCTDYILSYISRQLGLSLINWDDCGCYGGHTPNFHETGHYAITHRHKIDDVFEGIDPEEPLHAIVTCKGRWKHLSETLPLLLKQPNLTITVVDYGCPDSTAEKLVDRNEVLAKNSSSKQITVIDYSNQPGSDVFNLNRARNLGAVDKPDGWLAFVDADLLLHSGWADMIRSKLRPGRYYTAYPGKWGMSGSCVVESKAYHKVGGYDELYEGWGADDVDFYMRLRQSGVRPDGWDDSLASSIKHSDYDRVRFQTMEKEQSHTLSRIYFNLKRDWIIRHNRLPNFFERLVLFERALRIYAGQTFPPTS